MSRIIGFTGTRKGMSMNQFNAFVLLIHDFRIANRGHLEFHHGGCVGADAEAHAYVYNLGGDITVHPATVSRAFWARLNGTGFMYLKPKGALERNLDIVEACDVLIAAPLTDKEQQRSGTWATIRMARKLGKHIEILPR